MNRTSGLYRIIGHRFVDGWLAPEVLDLLSILDSAQQSKGIDGAVAEIGVHHGRLFIGLNLLQRSNENSVAIDVFGDQDLNVDQSGKGDLAAFRRNVDRWSSSRQVVVHQGDSTQLEPTQLRELTGGDVRFFSVDGGHTDSIVFSDMKLAEAALAPGGIVIADDVFNQEWPGVSTGTLRYLNTGGRLVPFAIGFNKVFFSTPEYTGFYFDVLSARLENRYLISTKVSEYATHPVLIIGPTPRRPRKLLGRNKIAKRIYSHVQDRKRRDH